MENNPGTAAMARHFDTLATAWSQCSFLDQEGEAEHVARLLKPLSTDTGLDLACGTGQLTARLATHGSRIMAADLSDRMLKLAACRFVEQRLRNIVITVQDAHHLEFANGLFDWVVCRWAFRSFEDPALVLRELARVTKPGARIYLSDWAEPAALLDNCLQLLDPFHRHVTTELWWDEALRGLPFTVEGRRLKAERLDPVVWGGLSGTPEEEALARFEGFRKGEGKVGRYLELDGRPVLIAERLELLLVRGPGRKPA